MDYTFQDFEEWDGSTVDFVKQCIGRYQSGTVYQTACKADSYDRQINDITHTIRTIYTLSGEKTKDPTVSNNKISSNFFRRLNTQRCTYSLGNGIEFAKKNIKEKLGDKIDTTLFFTGYDALIHGVSYLFVSDMVYEFKATEFVPIFDEYTGALRAGVRFWRISPEKSLVAVLYEEDGYTKFREDDHGEFAEYEKKSAYIQKVQKSTAFGEEIIGESNYPALPIVPLYGSRLKQSTLVGMKPAIDSYDLIRSGYANDLDDCAQIYWLLENYGGMSDEDLKKFLDRLKFQHAAVANTADGGRIAPYTQEPPYNAREAYLGGIKAQIYEDFGGLDVHTIAAGATNDHIDAAYQPLDENADDFEMQVIDTIQKIGAILNIPADDCVPIFKRNRISNQLETVQMLTMAAQWLDERTLLEKLPFLTVDEVEEILKRKSAEDLDRVMIKETDNESADGGELVENVG